jgi:hypothetical protein
VGSNIDRPLFNLRAEKGHHALIAGRTLKDGRISLYAGTAHGVRVNAIYGIYPSNLRDYTNETNKLGELCVEALNENDITATLRSGTANFPIPPFFYAAEERRYFSPVKISVPNGLEVLEGLSGWTPPASESEANITLQVEGRTTWFLEWPHR